MNSTSRKSKPNFVIQGSDPFNFRTPLPNEVFAAIEANMALYGKTCKQLRKAGVLVKQYEVVIDSVSQYLPGKGTVDFNCQVSW